MLTFYNLFISSSILPSGLGILWRNYSLEKARNQVYTDLEHNDRFAKKRTFLESKIKELSKKLEISEPELIVKKDCGTVATATTGIFPIKAVVFIDPDFVSTRKKDKLEFLIAHELSHIKGNDVLWRCAVRAIAGIVMTLAMTTLFPRSATHSLPPNPIFATSYAAVIGVIVSRFFVKFWTRWREECTDRLAYSICSKEGKEAAHKEWRDVRLEQKLLREKKTFRIFSFSSWKINLLLTKDGERRFHTDHPSLQTREDYLKTLWFDDVRNGRV